MGVIERQLAMQDQATDAAKQHAKTLRTGMTDAERRLWSRLRHEQLGVKFRRQHPIGSYVLDFACLERKLAIEIDGSQHLDQQPYDERRTAWLAGQGSPCFASGRTKCFQTPAQW
jgi:very-short-patch-repair endonuclease